MRFQSRSNRSSPHRDNRGVRSSRLALLLAMVAIVGGCSSMYEVEVQNDGPGPVTVTFRFRQDKRDVERVFELPAGGRGDDGIWYSEPTKLEIEAKWANAVVKRTYGREAIEEIRRKPFSGQVQGLSVSPDGFRWGEASLWIRLQNPALIPGALFVVLFGFSRWMRHRRLARRQPTGKEV